MRDIDEFLKEKVYFGLKNQNDGFDHPNKIYFSVEDFKIVLKRAERYNLQIFGIEPWKEGKMFDVYGFDDYNKKSNDSSWYFQAFTDFKKLKLNLVYSATFYFSV